MDFSTVLFPELVELDISLNSKNEVIHYMSNLLANKGKIKSAPLFEQAVLARENHSTTGVGNGIAIPHGRSEVVNQPSIAIVKLKEALDWQSLDEKPVNLVFMLAVPEEGGQIHLRMLSELAMKLMDEQLIQGLKKASTKQQVIEMLMEDEDEA